MRLTLTLLLSFNLMYACSNNYDGPTGQVKIIGGHDVTTRYVSEQAIVRYLTYKDKNKIPSSFCSGTFITDDLVLTAAHCVNTIKGAYLDDSRLSGTYNDYHVSLASIYIHPQYRSGKGRPFNYDVAIIDFGAKASRDLRVNSFPTFEKRDLAVDEFVKLCGFSVNRERHKPEETFEAYLSQSKLRCGFNRVSTIDEGSMRFTAARVDDEGAITQKGDSGGPAFDLNLNLIGVVSTGEINTSEFVNLTSGAHFEFIHRVKSCHALNGAQKIACMNQKTFSTSD